MKRTAQSIELLQGLPDFSSPVENPLGWVFGAFQRDTWLAMPRQLRLRYGPDELPDIELRLIRGELPFSPPAPSGILDIRVEVEFGLAEMLERLRKTKAASSLQAVRPALGFLHLSPVLQGSGTQGSLPESLSRPVPLNWDGANCLRHRLRMNIQAALSLEQMILQGGLPAEMYAEFFFSGVCPRFPLSLGFDASRLDALLGPEMDEDGYVLVATVRRIFATQAAELALNFSQVPPSGLAGDLMLDTIVDRVVTRFGRPVPAGEDGEARVELSIQDEASGQPLLVRWDLSRPGRVMRRLVLVSPVLTQLAKSSEQRQQLIRHVTVPAFNIGQYSLLIAANSGGLPAGLISMGAHLSVPSHAPDRPHAIHQTVQFTGQEMEVSTQLQLAPMETLHYYAQGFLDIQTDQGLLSLRGPVLGLFDSGFLVLPPEAFAARFLSISAGESLLELASVSVLVAYVYQEKRHQISFDLEPGASEICIVEPEGAMAPVIEVQIGDRLGSQVLPLHQPVQGDVCLDLEMFTEYGHHTVEIRCELDDSLNFCEVECIAEDQVGQVGAGEMLFFLQDLNSRSYWWFASSPFTPGFCYRTRAEREQEYSAWSAPVRDGQELELHVSLTGTAPGSPDVVSVTRSGVS